MAKTYVLSDVHIGDDKMTCWYQKSYHEPYLIAVLDHLLQNKAEVDEVILLGDLFDFWTYAPDDDLPSIDQILNANPNVFGPSGKLTQVVEALPGKVKYLRGNHDINITQADLNKLPGKNKIQLIPDVYVKGDVLYMHGHLYTIFNAPDVCGVGIPVGHFVTRSIMYKIKKDRKPAFELPGQGSPSGLGALISDKLLRATSLPEVMLDGVTNWAGMPTSTSIKLFNQQQKSINQAKSDYANLRPIWLAQYGGGEYAQLTVIKSILADAKDYYMGWFAQKAALEQGANLVVMGHTHIPKLGLVEAAANYINSGYMCPSKPDVEQGKAKFTFAVIDHPSGQSSQPKLYQVVKQGNAFRLEETSAPPARIIDPPTAEISDLIPRGEDFSCYVWLVNQTGQELRREQLHAAQGVYVVNPPEKIGVGQTARLWIQDYPGVHGSEGSVGYTTKDGKRIDLRFACPTGVFKNSCSGATFETKSGNGNWKNQLAEWGHPFFVRFTLSDPTANFQGACGEGGKGNPKSVVSTTGLEPGGAVHINGKTDLSACIVGNDGARVHGITLSRTSGIYNYVVNVDAQGPSGAFSGSMYLAFRDRTGDTYYLSVFRSARVVHTVAYNSNNPAIVKIWWCNYEFKV